MHRFVLAALAALCTLAPASRAQEPVLDKPASEGVARAVPEAALRPPRPLDVLHYDLRFEVNADNAYLVGEVGIRLVPLQPMERLVLDFDAHMRTDSVAVDGLARSFVHEADSLSVVLDTPVTPTDTMQLFVDFEGTPLRPAGVGFGWARRLFSDGNGQGDPDRPVLATLSEPVAARSWWPCHDHPFDNATFRLTTIGPTEFTLAAPGRRIEDSDLGNGRRRQAVDMTTPVPSYLVSLVLTDQEVWTESVVVDVLQPDGTVTERDMPLEYYSPAHLRPACEYTWSNTDEMILLFQEMFGPYPYADIKYGMSLFVFGGAMEHPTLSSMGEYTVGTTPSSNYPGPGGESVVAHELAHQWFGDAVHVGRWGDIWLNEGFARYCEVLWIESFYGADAGKTWMDRIWSESWNGPLRDPLNLFSSTVYNKGAWVLHQLRQVIGYDELLRAMREYVTDPALRFGPVFVEDFQAHCEAVYGAPLDWYFEPWLEWEGRPAVAVDWTAGPTGVNGTVNQPAGRVYRLPLPVQIRLASGETRDEIVWIGEAGPDDTFEFATASEVVDLRIDAGRNWLLDLDVPVRPPVELVGIGPNPARTQSTVSFIVRHPSHVRADIYDLRGRFVRTLFDGNFDPRVHARAWDGRDEGGASVASGVYVLRLRSDAGEDRRKFTLVR
jgi:aminopeptidase N